jgi:hypothetical protein
MDPMETKFDLSVVFVIGAPRLPAAAPPVCVDAAIQKNVGGLHYYEEMDWQL